jgi:hypothetical protein
MAVPGETSESMAIPCHTPMVVSMVPGGAVGKRLRMRSIILWHRATLVSSTFIIREK